MKYALLFIAIVGMFFLVGCMEHDMEDMGTMEDMSNDNILVPNTPHLNMGDMEGIDMGGMVHGKIEVDPDNMPTVDLTVHTDPKAGWNLEIKTENFELAPESASLDHADGEGHMHLYIDGNKITRLYGEWFHIPKEWLKPGIYEITVGLSGNNHSDYVLNGEIITDSKTITVS